MIRIFVGYDPREAATYHTLTQSIIDTCTVPFSITPLNSKVLGLGQGDGTNAFTYTRFLVPWLCGFEGWAIYMDSDMLARADLTHLWRLRCDDEAVMVCQHHYKTKAQRKLIGTAMEANNADYPRKCWSSMMLWNCGHAANGHLHPIFVREQTPAYLHRFEWLSDLQIAMLPLTWNWLVGELDYNPYANVAHFTLGAPGFAHYRNCEYSQEWHKSFAAVKRMDQLGTDH